MVLTEETFRRLVFDVNARRVNFAGRYVEDRESASDIVQESYISLWNQYHGKTVYRASEELVYRNLVSDLSGDVPLICKDLSKVINDSMSTLPPRCMEIFRMSRVERKTNREISVALGISEKAVEKQISKALRILSSYAAASCIPQIRAVR